jgi:hypothetical protein
MVSELIQKTLGNPTHEMHIAFNKLPTAHKWLLFAFLELEGRSNVADIL